MIRAAALLSCVALANTLAAPPGAAAATGRRAVLAGGAGALLAGPAAAARAAAAESDDVVRSPRMRAYELVKNDPVCMQPRTPTGEKRLLGELAQADVVVLGVHGAGEVGVGGTASAGLVADAALAAAIIGGIAAKRGGAGGPTVGLGSAPPFAQPALDAFGAGGAAAADAALPPGLDAYGPVLRVAARQKLPLRALGLPPALTAAVNEKGLEAVSGDRERYLDDVQGFLELVQTPVFQIYAQQLILPNRPEGAAAPSKEKYFASRIFSDEALATNALRTAAALRGEGGGPLVLLAPYGSVAFGSGGGVDGRLRRAAGNVNLQGKPLDVRSVLLNPTAKDTTSLTNSLRLQLGTHRTPGAETAVPLADYVWFDHSPKPQVLTRMFDPVS